MNTYIDRYIHEYIQFDICYRVTYVCFMFSLFIFYFLQMNIIFRLPVQQLLTTVKGENYRHKWRYSSLVECMKRQLLDNQLSCIINYAYNNFIISRISSWQYEKVTELIVKNIGQSSELLTTIIFIINIIINHHYYYHHHQSSIIILFRNCSSS